MKRLGITLLMSLTLSSPVAMAAVSDADFAALRADLAALAQRFEALAAENAQLKQQGQQTAMVAQEAKSTAVAAQESSGGGWTERVTMDGDFRYRFENIDVEGKDDRNRSRIRARANIRASLPQNTEVGFGLATGGDDPVSANQTIGSGGSSKNIRLNLAYAKWNAGEGLNLIAGKFKNPLVRVAKNPLMWDGDWTPEGLALTYERDWFFLNALGTWLDSDSSGGNTNFSWGGQIGATGELGGVALKGGVGYFAIKTKGDTTYFGDPTDPGDFFGNTAVEVGTGLSCGTTTGTTCVYLFDYLLTEVFGEATFDMFGFPTVVFFDATNNSDPSANDTSWKLGTRIGKTKDRGQAQFSYWYAEKEADGVFGLLTDSDWAGGGTDNEGHFLKLAVGINKQWAIGAQYFINELNVSSGTKTDYNRLMLDTQWKWK
ncbi:MAG: putative porin [Gammaproteobacteria bacterium]